MGPDGGPGRPTIAGHPDVRMVVGRALDTEPPLEPQDGAARQRAVHRGRRRVGLGHVVRIVAVDDVPDHVRAAETTIGITAATGRRAVRPAALERPPGVGVHVPARDDLRAARDRDRHRRVLGRTTLGRRAAVVGVVDEARDAFPGTGRLVSEMRTVGRGDHVRHARDRESGREIPQREERQGVDHVHHRQRITVVVAEQGDVHAGSRRGRDVDVEHRRRTRHAAAGAA